VYEGAVLEKMRWSKPLGPYDDQYYEQATFVLVKESPTSIRIKLIDKYRKDYNGLVFWMSKKITKSYNNSDPNIKTAWFWEKAFNNNANKALKELENRAHEVHGVDGIPIQADSACGSPLSNIAESASIKGDKKLNSKTRQ
jgi:hypothetical protein